MPMTTSRPPPVRKPVRGSRSGRPIMALLDILGRRWTLRVLWELRDGSVKFRSLAERADAMSQSVLSRRLKELEAARLVVGDEDGWRLSREGTVLLERLMPLSEFAREWAALQTGTHRSHKVSGQTLRKRQRSRRSANPREVRDE
jgi:DNA-binding HxlR family transcriptional regulator